jgi:cyclic dehypoxanthinyl futalosine synthase
MVSINKETLTDKVLAGKRITPEDALVLYEWPLEELGALADHRRRLAKRSSYKGSGNEIVTYIVDRNINYTNVCNVYCKFCAFYRTEKDDDHYVITFVTSKPSRSEWNICNGFANSRTAVVALPRSSAGLFSR